MNAHICLLVMLACGCAGRPSGTNAAVALTYEAEQLTCVEKASTLAESQACRCAVKARYNRPCVKDAGVE